MLPVQSRLEFYLEAPAEGGLRAHAFTAPLSAEGTSLRELRMNIGKAIRLHFGCEHRFVLLIGAPPPEVGGWALETRGDETA